MSSRRVRTSDSHNDAIRLRPQSLLFTAACLWCVSSVVVVIGVLCGVHLIRLCTVHPDSGLRDGVLRAFACWDGVWYCRIADGGYSYNPDAMSSVAFFPLYPSMARVIV